MVRGWRREITSAMFIRLEESAHKTTGLMGNVVERRVFNNTTVVRYYYALLSKYIEQA